MISARGSLSPGRSARDALADSARAIPRFDGRVSSHSETSRDRRPRVAGLSVTSRIGSPLRKQALDAARVENCPSTSETLPCGARTIYPMSVSRAQRLPGRSRRRGRWSSRWRRRNVVRRVSPRRRWRRSQSRLRLSASGNWDLMTLGVHALHVRDVIATLHRPASLFGVAGADETATEEPGSRADGRPHRGIAGCGANRRAGGSADDGADGGGGDGGVVRGAVRGYADVIRRPLPAYLVVVAELVEALSGARERHDVRSRRHAHARREREARENWQQRCFPHHRLL